MPREQQVSRKVSWLLRHGAGSEGLKLGQGGYVGVADAVSSILPTFGGRTTLMLSSSTQTHSSLSRSHFPN